MEKRPTTITDHKAETDSTREKRSSAEPGDAEGIVSRFDSAHPVQEVVAKAAEERSPGEEKTSADPEVTDDSLPPADESLLSAAAGRSEAHLAEQLHTQALQLAEHLRTKQREIDRREALLNAHDARIENDLRLARLWLREREHALSELQKELTERQTRLDQQTADVAACEHAARAEDEVHKAELSLQQQLLAAEREALADDRTRLAAEREALEVAAERLEQQRVEQATEQLAAQQKFAMHRWETEQQLQHQLRNLTAVRAALDARERELEAKRDELANGRSRQAWESRLAGRERELAQAEQLLARHSVDLEHARAALAAEREKWRQEAKAERRTIAERAQRERAALAKQRQQVEVAREAVDRHRAIVEQLRTDAAKLHREGLEMRLVAEQLWLELAQHTPPVELTRSLSDLRKRLAEHFRAATSELAARQEELVQLSQRLEQQQQRLVEQRAELKAWRSVQEREIEVQAARLVAREQELDAQERTMSAEAERWTGERRELQQQIRDLLARVRKQEPLARAA